MGPRRCRGRNERRKRRRAFGKDDSSFSFVGVVCLLMVELISSGVLLLWLSCRPMYKAIGM